MIEPRSRKMFVNANREIDVGGSGLASGKGPEQRNARDTRGSKLLFVSAKDGEDSVPVHSFILRIQPVVKRPLRVEEPVVIGGELGARLEGRAGGGFDGGN